MIPTHHDRDNEATPSDHDLVHRSVARITIHETRIDIALKTAEQQQDFSDQGLGDRGLLEDGVPAQLSMPFAPNHPLRKGIAPGDVAPTASYSRAQPFDCVFQKSKAKIGVPTTLVRSPIGISCSVALRAMSSMPRR